MPRSIYRLLSDIWSLFVARALRLAQLSLFVDLASACGVCLTLRVRLAMSMLAFFTSEPASSGRDFYNWRQDF